MKVDSAFIIPVVIGAAFLVAGVLAIALIDYLVYLLSPSTRRR